MPGALDGPSKDRRQMAMVHARSAAATRLRSRAVSMAEGTALEQVEREGTQPRMSGTSVAALRRTSSELAGAGMSRQERRRSSLPAATTTPHRAALMADIEAPPRELRLGLLRFLCCMGWQRRPRKQQIVQAYRPRLLRKAVQPTTIVINGPVSDEHILMLQRLARGGHELNIQPSTSTALRRRVAAGRSAPIARSRLFDDTLSRSRTLRALPPAPTASRPTLRLTSAERRPRLSETRESVSRATFSRSVSPGRFPAPSAAASLRLAGVVSPPTYRHSERAAAISVPRGRDVLRRRPESTSVHPAARQTARCPSRTRETHGDGRDSSVVEPEAAPPRPTTANPAPTDLPIDQALSALDADKLFELSATDMEGFASDTGRIEMVQQQLKQLVAAIQARTERAKNRTRRGPAAAAEQPVAARSGAPKQAVAAAHAPAPARARASRTTPVHVRKRAPRHASDLVAPLKQGAGWETSDVPAGLVERAMPHTSVLAVTRDDDASSSSSSEGEVIHEARAKFGI
ncbi:unnamed protein product [Pedinophyceae sp. YPF-701]|nr:unnamed protein product [Pedinophyceae sp. YPF-701]